jgi:FtsH-binding integral membrane protein
VLSSVSVLPNVGIRSRHLPGLLSGIWFGANLGCIYHAYSIGQRGKSEKERESHAYWMHALMGVAITPAIVMYRSVVPQAVVTTVALVAGSITTALFLPKGSLLSWGSALYSGLWGLVGVGAVSVLFPVLGWTHAAGASQAVQLFGGVALFSVYNAFDTHAVIQDYQSGLSDAIGHATNYSLNAINIFVKLLDILYVDEEESSDESSPKHRKKRK